MATGLVQLKPKARNSRQDWPASVLARYQRCPSRRNAGFLLDCFGELVDREVALFQRRLPPAVDAEDLRQAALFALLKAARRFDPARGVPFASFSLARIRGAIQDELRSLDWGPRRKGSVLGPARIILGLLGDLPEDAESRTVEPADEDRTPDLLDALHRQELLEKVKRSVTTLEWRILHDTYVRGLSLRVVARRLSLSASQVCTLRAGILAKVRRLLEVEPV